MKYSYTIIETNHADGVLVEYAPPAEFPSLLVIRAILPYPISAATTQEEISAMVEARAPIEDWEEVLDNEANGTPDFSDIDGVPHEVEMAAPLAPKSKIQRMAEHVKAAEEARALNTPPVQIEV